MGVRIGTFNVVHHSVTQGAICPRFLFDDIDKVNKYIREHPFPSTDIYSEQDLRFDLKSESFWSVPDGLTAEQEEWICEFAEAF